ncbi:MAG: hypothetical protein JJ59_00150 [Candidatus Micrarchaeum sp. AZ1]|jgi:GT2 family glycosyltransferase|nr:MAG: hypothetical protein JJ59_00150 [Candidatus Micrarchaeum sp. AZ1]
MTQPKVVIIISNYNGASTIYNDKNILYQCLKSLESTTYKNYKIIVTDAHSTDNSREVVFSFRGVKFIDIGHKAAFSENNNFAIDYAMKKYNPDYYLLLNNDIIITDKSWLKKLVETAEKYKAGIVGCQLLYPNNNIQHAGLLIGYYGGRNRGRGEKYAGQYDLIEKMPAVTFAVAIINKKVIKKIGLLDENFYMGFEDADYCLRATQAGFKVFYNGKTKLTHLEGFSSTNAKSKAVRFEYFYSGQKNFVFFMLKHKEFFNFKNKLKALFIYFLSAIIIIEGPDKKRSLLSIRFKRHLWKNIISSFKAQKEAKQLYKKLKY